ncbi:MAG: DUF2490 domain-containing protein [Chitinophagales bacterium]|nr:DUF2490 domain-containing protein [Chitinophagales bacterium]MDW8419668.1 DUF2490 domain-containing protein [Chitinophagales bacterium]
MHRVVTILFVLSICSASALEPVQNRQLWLWWRFSKQLPKNFTVGAQYQLRLGHNMSTFIGQNFYGTVGYRFNKYLSSQFTYQFFTSHRRDNHTFFVSLTARYRVRKFTFLYRTAYQRVQPYFHNRYEPGIEPINEWRNRITLRYRINSKFDVYGFCEPFLNFNPVRNAQGRFVSKIRNSVGIDWHFYRYNTLTLFYIFQPEFFARRPQHQHVLGAIYEFELPRKPKWKKFFHPGKGKKPAENDERDTKDQQQF